jgi:hypothetical protein
MYLMSLLTDINCRQLLAEIMNFSSSYEYFQGSKLQTGKCIGSTAFLVGPGQQVRMMLDPVRIYATAIYVGCVVVALVCALWVSWWLD